MKHLLFSLIAFVTAATQLHAADWRATLDRDLPLFGHRNWIVVTDSAYPAQTTPGVETVVADGEPLTVIREVLKKIDQQKHVRPIIYTDAEMPFVTEKNASGIGAYRSQLAKILKGHDTQSLLHEQLIAKLDEAGKTFRVLIIKTDGTLPYTSVFFRLDCRYWSAAAEKELRAAMKNALTAQ